VYRARSGDADAHVAEKRSAAFQAHALSTLDDEEPPLIMPITYLAEPGEAVQLDLSNDEQYELIQDWFYDDQPLSNI
jgi:hypothetical protein